jgi:hypothetical protein
MVNLEILPIKFDCFFLAIFGYSRRKSNKVCYSTRKEETMTRNQLMYWELQEQKRANRAKENLTDYSNQTGRQDVSNKFTIGSEGNVIQSRKVDNEFMLGNLQQQSNARQAGAAERQAKVAEERIPIYQLEADIKQKQVDVARMDNAVKRMEAHTNRLRAETYEAMSENDKQKAQAALDKAEADLKNAETNYQRMKNDLWAADQNLQIRAKDVTSAIKRRDNQNQVDWFKATGDWIDSIIPF